MNLLERAVVHLQHQGVECAVIGAAALAVHGIARSTIDLDVLVADRRCLDHAFWQPVREAGVDVALRRGDAADPLAGVIRLAVAGEPNVDVVVGKPRWHAEVIRRAIPARVDGVEVRAADLILLKLYAGGPQDAWDIAQLLATCERPALSPEVEARLDELPAEARHLWTRIVDAERRP